MEAKPVNAVKIIQVDNLPDGDTCLITNCEDYGNYKNLPKAVRYNSDLFALTGWNSDRCVAYYKNNMNNALGFPV